ncbi:MAG: diguanylate cyclase [Magnetococcales bacterium]|nr:diguanylate cyclase [Magnetococcales bacterium]
MATILVVDDDSQAVEQVVPLLEQVGHQADFLLEAPYLFQRLAADRPDLILLDVNMPEVDGLTLLGRLMAADEFRDIPVIMVTAERDEQLIARCFDAGAVDFLGKPVRAVELQSRIKIALATRAHILEISRQRDILERARMFNETVVNAMEDVIVLLDGADLTILETNQALLDRLAAPRDGVVGHRCHDWLAGRPTLCPRCADADPPRCLPATALQQQTNQVEERMEFPEDGRRTFTKIMTVPIARPPGTTGQVLFVSRDVTARREAEERLKHLAFHDSLTGLPNRQLFRDRLEQALAQARRRRQLVAVIGFDLDRFKQINDTLGHAMGDLLLQQVGRRLQACVRESDTVARLGGDEFTAILTNLTDLSPVERISTKMLKSLARKHQLEEHRLTVTCSMGISLFPIDGEDQDSLTRAADRALYRAKSQGRNNIQFAASPQQRTHLQSLIGTTDPLGDPSSPLAGN